MNTLKRGADGSCGNAMVRNDLSRDSKGQCEFAKDATNGIPRCPYPATRKIGDNWFCDFHGSRHEEIVAAVGFEKVTDCLDMLQKHKVIHQKQPLQEDGKRPCIWYPSEVSSTIK